MKGIILAGGSGSRLHPITRGVSKQLLRSTTSRWSTTRCIAAALVRGEPREVYNIGGGNKRTNREITTIILDELRLDWDKTVEKVTDRPGHDRRYSITCAKAGEKLGWSPKVEFAEGLRETIRWYRENEWWWSKIKHHTEEFADWRKRWYDDRA